MSDQQRGLYAKFTVTRRDGSSAPGGKHDGCNYFVLDVTHDKHADAALRAYADSCEGDYPALAADLRDLAGQKRPLPDGWHRAKYTCGCTWVDDHPAPLVCPAHMNHRQAPAAAAVARTAGSDPEPPPRDETSSSSSGRPAVSSAPPQDSEEDDLALETARDILDQSVCECGHMEGEHAGHRETVYSPPDGECHGDDGECECQKFAGVDFTVTRCPAPSGPQGELSYTVTIDGQTYTRSVAMDTERDARIAADVVDQILTLSDGDKHT